MQQQQDASLWLATLRQLTLNELSGKDQTSPEGASTLMLAPEALCLGHLLGVPCAHPGGGEQKDTALEGGALEAMEGLIKIMSAEGDRGGKEGSEGGKKALGVKRKRSLPAANAGLGSEGVGSSSLIPPLLLYLPSLLIPGQASPTALTFNAKTLSKAAMQVLQGQGSAGKAPLSLPVRHFALEALQYIVLCLRAYDLGLNDVLPSGSKGDAVCQILVHSMSSDSQRSSGVLLPQGLLAMEVLLSLASRKTFPSWGNDLESLVLPSLGAEAAALVLAILLSQHPNDPDYIFGSACESSSLETLILALLLPPRGIATSSLLGGTAAGTEGWKPLEGRCLNLPSICSLLGVLPDSQPLASEADPAGSIDLRERLLISVAAAAKHPEIACSSCLMHGPMHRHLHGSVNASSARKTHEGLLGEPLPVSCSGCRECTASRSLVLELLRPKLNYRASSLIAKISQPRDHNSLIHNAASWFEAACPLVPHMESSQLVSMSEAVSRAALKSLHGEGIQPSDLVAGGLQSLTPSIGVKGTKGRKRSAAPTDSDSVSLPSRGSLTVNEGALTLVALAFKVSAAALPTQGSGEALVSSQALLALVSPNLGSSTTLLSARDDLLAAALQWDAIHRQRLQSNLPQESAQPSPSSHGQQDTSHKSSVLNSKLWLQSVLLHPTPAASAQAATMLHVGRLACRSIPAALDAAPSSDTRKRSLALLLPLVGSLLAHDAGTKQQLTVLAALYREPLLAYAMRKRRKLPKETSADGSEGRPLRPGEMDPAALVDLDVIASLKGHAVPVLLACLKYTEPLEASERERLMAKLLPPGESGASR